MDQDKLEIMRHSAAHLLAAAVAELYPGAKFGVGPVIENGFYYDIETAESISEDDLAKIEKKMKHMVKQNIAFEREEMSIDEAIKMFKDADQPYKVELLTDLKEKGTTKISEEEAQDVGESPDQVSIYTTGKFVDLCRGPHVESSKDIKVVKLTRVAGAYWRGDEKKPMLTRVYGTAFESQAELDKYLEMLEEAKRRDHRKIGKEQELFLLDPEVGLGLPMWFPKGAQVWRIIEDYWYQQHYAHGYELVRSPHIGNIELWNKSGHTQFYQDDMYSPIEVDDEQYLLKPMNCPFHVKLYKARPHSYRELPLRWAECATVYRYEKSGQLSGLTRVRGFTQDDAHIICRKEQVEEELQRVVEFIQEYFQAFGLTEYKVYLSLRDPNNKDKYAGDDAGWEFTEGVLRKIADQSGMEYESEEGEAAFYGPKLDFKFKDLLGREWQCPTLQFDFNLPERFDMTFVNEQGEEERPYMLHRTIMGSFERFMAVLIEHYGGAWPMWLAPVQVRLVSVGEGHVEFANELAAELKGAGVRVEVDDGDDTVGNKIRKAAGEKIPWTIVLGDKEVGGEPFKVRVFGQELELELKREELVEQIKEESKI